MAVNLILKNTSGSDVDVELIDMYGGNFTANIPADTAQNHGLMEGRDIVVNGQTVHTVTSADENMEIVVA